MVHFHVYVSRVPGLLANGNAESQPEAPGFRISNVPPQITRRWLLRDSKMITETFATPELAADWYAEWIVANPRPDGAYFPEDPQGEQRARMVEFTLKALMGANDRVDGFYTPGGEYVSASIIACPPRDGKWPCPLGRTS